MTSTTSPSTSDAGRDVLAWRRVQSVATLGIALSLGAVLLLTMELIPPVLFFSVLFLGVTLLLWMKPANRWISVASAILVVLAMLGNLPFFVEDLSHPETWASFAPAAVMVVGAVAAVGATVMAWRAAPAAGTRRFSLGAAALGTALVVFTVALSLGTSSETAEAGDVTLTAEGTEFPETLEVASGGAVFLQNRDLYRHTFVIDEQGVKVEMPGGKDRRVVIDLAAGEYRFHCDVPGHERMEGTLTVR